MLLGQWSVFALGPVWLGFAFPSWGWQAGTSRESCLKHYMAATLEMASVKYTAIPAAQVLVALPPHVPAFPKPETLRKNVLLHGMKIAAGHRSSFPNHSPRAVRTSGFM